MDDQDHSPQPPPSTHSLEDGAGDEVAPPPSPPLPPADVDSGPSPAGKNDSPVPSSAPITTIDSPPTQPNLTGAQAAPPPPFLPLASYANDNLAQPRASTGRGEGGGGENAGGASGLVQQQQGGGSVVGAPFSSQPRYAPQPYPSSYSHAFSQHHYPYSPRNTTNAHLDSQCSISPSFNSSSTRAQFSLDTVVSRSALPHTHSTAAFRLETQAVPGRTVFSAVSPAERSAPVPAPQQDEQGGKGGLAMLVTAGQALATPQTSAVEPEREEDVESSGTRKRPIEEDEEGKARSRRMRREKPTTLKFKSHLRRSLFPLRPPTNATRNVVPLQQRPHPTHPHPQPLSYSPYAPYHPQAFAPSPNAQAALPHFQHQPYPLAPSAPSAAPFSALGPFAYPSDPGLYNAAVANLLARQQAAVGAGFGGAAGPPPLPSSAGRYGHGATCFPGGEVVGSAGASAGGEEPLSPYSTFSADFSTGSPSTVATSPGLSRATPKSVAHPLAPHQQFQAQGRALPLVSKSGGEGSGGRGGGVPIFGSGQQQRDEQGEEEGQEEVPEHPKKPRGRTKARDDAYVIETVTGCKPFINKLRWLVLHPDEVGDVIGWSDSGNEVIVKYEDERLLNEVLPRTFAHEKMQSFHRQFLSYSFKQVKPPAVAASILNPPRPPRPTTAFSFSGSGSAEDEEEEEEEEEELDVNEWRVYRHSHTPADFTAARKGEKEVERNRRAAEKRKRDEAREESDEEDEGSEEEEEEAQDDGSVWFSRDKINDHVVLRRLKPNGKGGAAAGGGGGGRGGSPAQEKKAPAVAAALQGGLAVPSPSPGPSPSPHVQQPAFSAYRPRPQPTYQFSSAQPPFLSGAASSSSSSTFTPQQYVPYPILQQHQSYHPHRPSASLAIPLLSSSTAHLPPAPVSGPPTRGSAAVTGLLRPSLATSVSVSSSAAVQGRKTPERTSTSTSVQEGEQQEGLRRSGRKRSATKGGYVDEIVEEEA